MRVIQNQGIAGFSLVESLVDLLSQILAREEQIHKILLLLQKK